VFGLYVHIPWCRTKCPYCDFNSYPARRPPEERYAEALQRELRRRAREEPWRDASVGSVFFGGGTPSLFAASTIEQVLRTIFECFPAAPDVEVTLEANPGTVTLERLAGWRKAGVNRISFGIQSFQPRTLAVLGRLHGAEEARLAVPMARAAGFANVNVDLMFAVPGQSLDDWRGDLQTAIGFAPEHVSAYQLTYEEGTAFFALRAAGRLRPVDEDDEAEMFEEARRILGAAGYRAYEISNFARPGFESRHNRNYWEAGPYLGIGAGAHSWHRLEDGGVRWANERDPIRYMARVLREETAVDTIERLDRGESAREFAFLGLRLEAGFSEEEFRRRFGAPPTEVFPGLLDVERQGLLVRERGKIRLSERGLRLADSVFASAL
jgi:oxygen-independent coproporphyrinogen-3 oxidase